MRENISVSDAQNFILDNIKVLSPEILPLQDSLNKILSKDIYSKINIPPFDNSAMDGYAIRSQDTKSATRENPVYLIKKGEISAGCYKKLECKNGYAIKIMTGAPVPPGCNAVVKKEDTQEINDRVKVFKECEVGENIRKKGEDIKKDELVLKKGTKIGKFEIGILASLGYDKLSVIPSPKVGIISTGDELVEPGKKLSPGKIYNSNAWTLFGMIKELDCEVIYFGIVKDKKVDLQNVFKKAAKKCNIIVTSGGVSVGEYDIVKDVLQNIGKINLWKVKMRPGHPLAFGKINKTPVFGLPGNPVSVAVSFLQFVRPSILKMKGESNLFLKEVDVIVDEDIKKKKGFIYFLRGKSYIKDGELHCKTTGPQGSGILKSLHLADILLVLPEEAEFIKCGSKIKAQVL